jgi:hypothetical protein
LAAQAGFTAAGGGPDDIFLTSWYPYPSHNLPEDAATDFPFMRTVLAVATNAAIIPRSFPAGATPIAQPS